VGEAPPAAHLWLLDIGAAIEDGGASRHGTHALRRLTGGSDRSVTLFSEAGLRRAFSFSPDGRHIVFSHADSALILDTIRSDISIVDTTTGDVRPVVVSDHWDETPLFSPDGTQILFGRTVVSDWLEDKALMVVPTTGGQARRLSIGFTEDVRDTQPLLVDWGVQGIEALFLSGTDRLIYRIEPETGRAARISPAELRVQEADVSDDGGTLAFVGVEATQAPEVYRLDLAHGGGAERLSHASGALADWPNHASFLVHWMTEDAVRIEGVLYQPEGLSPRARAPLIVVLHGGPRDVAYPARLHNQMYPIEQWLARGARILFPNYRGSTGYGASFRQLIVGNTGQAEMQDIAAAVEHFVATGLADEQQIGVVGHSWGGYLAAFAAATTDLFAAISVGSGISDNRVNYALSIAGVAEEGYLGSLPWAKLELWSATSPITHVTGEEAPVLILHGVDDAVVPVANAQLLHKALTDMGAIARLVLFDETGHDVSRPKEMRAWMQLNLEWFSQHLWRDERTDRRGDG
ncbi:MAG: alpha/beta fold hydrolase, partial [Pseudomonadota bacterium]